MDSIKILAITLVEVFLIINVVINSELRKDISVTLNKKVGKTNITIKNIIVIGFIVISSIVCFSFILGIKGNIA